MNPKIEQREKNREQKALIAAKIEQKIKEELRQRFKSVNFICCSVFYIKTNTKGVYEKAGMYNFTKEYLPLLDELEEQESEVEGEEEEEEEQEQEQEFDDDIEFVEDVSDIEDCM